MKTRLFVLPGSHPAMAARLMLERKGIDYSRIDLVPVLAKGILRAAGFPGVTVPALRLDGERTQGSRAIARALERAVPEPPLLPSETAEPERRAEVEEAERWADQEFQELPRRLIWNILSRDPRGRRSYLEGARLGLPVGLATRTAPPLIHLSKRFNGADDLAVQADLERLPAVLDRVDGLLASGVIGGAQPNVADFQIATCLRLLLTMDDVRDAFEGRPCEDYALRLVPEYPGYAPAALPDSWKPWQPAAAADRA